MKMAELGCTRLGRERERSRREESWKTEPSGAMGTEQRRGVGKGEGARRIGIVSSPQDEFVMTPSRSRWRLTARTSPAPRARDYEHVVVGEFRLVSRIAVRVVNVQHHDRVALFHGETLTHFI